MTRYNQAIAKGKNECNHIDQIRFLCGDKTWDMADRKAKSLIYLSLGIEGRKMLARKFPHTNVETKTTMELWDELEQTFIRPRNVTFDRYLLLTRKQHREEIMEQFHSALRSLEEHCQLVDLEDELLRDKFTANMIHQEKLKEMLKTTLTPERSPRTSRKHRTRHQKPINHTGKTTNGCIDQPIHLTRRDSHGNLERTPPWIE